ncbi:MAG TPA: hypothetical protein VG734_16385 [Lacunisphaera sp.]|nr:hypothetical protein [Lacunisphaera sp.]
MSEFKRSAKKSMRAQLLLAVLMFASAISPCPASEAEDVALRGLEAMNRNQGEQFISVAHPKLIQKFRDMMLARVEKSVASGSIPKELKDWYGVSSVDEMRALPFELVAHITVDRMSDSEPARLRQMMRTAQFAVVRSKVLDPDSVLVTISVDVGDGRQPKTVDVISRTADKIWKYWGFPELAKE